MQTATPSPVQSTPDLAAIKQRQQATWACGDYAVVGTTLQIVGETLAEAADVRGGERVLDVAAGNGNASLAAARRFASVVSTDYVSTLLDKGAQRARAEGLAIAFQVADVEDLPFADGSFDVVLSTFGAMFAPDHQRTASEMLRVLRPGGRLGMANWKIDIDTEAFDNLSEDGWEPTYGVGIGAHFGSLGVRAEWEQFNADDLDADISTISLSVTYTFL